ncbi:RNA polymerase 2 transcription elongation factor [Apiospora arundinis]
MAPPGLDFEPVSSMESECGHIFKSDPPVELHHTAEPVKPFSLVNTDKVVEEDSYAVQAPLSQASSASSSSKSWLPLNHVMVSVNKPTSGATKLRKMIFKTKGLIVCPGVYDGLSARTAIEVGFDAMYMTGAGTTASRLGQPDLAIAQLHEMRENAEMIANLDPFGPPLIADMDTGYGGPIMAARTVEQYIRAGVAGAHLEDQVLTKRCGHLSGKKVVPRKEFISRIRAAHAARVRMQSDFVLIARTDALQQLGFDECIARLKEARDEGADVGLLEGYETREQAQRAVQDLAPWPLLLNSVENGKSPTITVDEARAMGFRIMIFSFATLAPAYLAIKETLLRLKNQGIVGTPKNVTPVTLFKVCGLEHSMDVDMNAGGASFKGGV